MGLIHNTDDSEISRIWKELKRLATATPLSNASVSNGQTIFYGNLAILVSGSGQVTGVWIIDGELQGEGTLGWTGLAAFDGPVEITDTLDVLAATKLRGLVELFSDLRVKLGGKITVEGASAATLQNGMMSFSGGGRVRSEPGGVALDSGGTGAQVLVYGSSVQLGAGAAALLVSAGTVRATGSFVASADATVTGTFFNPGVTPDSASANVSINTTTGRLYRVSSASKYKTLIGEPELLPELLDVRVKDWVDNTQAERAIDLYNGPRPMTQADQLEWDSIRLRRIPGVIAEEVEAAGGAQFVTYGAAGEIESVAYDRLAIARTQILADRLELAMAEIAELKKHLAT